MGTLCPFCHHENMVGAPRCAECLHSLMDLDLPTPSQEDVLQNVMMTAPVSALLTGKDLLVASPTDSVRKVVRILQKEQKSCILIYDKTKLVGIVSSTDLLRKVAGKTIDLDNTPVSHIMTKNPETLKAKENIAVAVNKMAMGGFRRIPVLREDGTPYSVITIKDVLSYLTHHKGHSENAAP